MIVRTRFAPSPTGYLHIGGVRTALFNWLFARQAGGSSFCGSTTPTKQRHVEASRCSRFCDGFRWLGLDWDEGPEVGAVRAARIFNRSGETAISKRSSGCWPAGPPTGTIRRPRRYQQERQAAEAARQPFVYSRRWGAESGRRQAAALRRERAAGGGAAQDAAFGPLRVLDGRASAGEVGLRLGVGS